MAVKTPIGSNTGTRTRKGLLKNRIAPLIKAILPHDDNTSNYLDYKSHTSTNSSFNGNAVPPVTIAAESAPPENTNIQTDTVISETALLFMRAKTIVFQASGLKPLTKYYPFFNEVYVGQYCSITSGQLSSDIVTDAYGNVTGNFYLPGGVFPTGSLPFKLVDHVDNDVAPNKPDPLYGSAESTYEAHGTLKTMSAQVTPEAPIDNIPVTAPVNITNPAPIPIIPIPTDKLKCQEWVFEYRILSDQTRKTFTVTTNSRLPPENPRPTVGHADTATTSTEVSMATYMNTTMNNKGQYIHQFSYIELTYSNMRRQIWRGPTVLDKIKDLPILKNFRPSGLLDTQTIQIAKDWALSQELVACPSKPGFFTALRHPFDPLAQSFYVDNNLYPNGMYISSIEVFFKTVDQSTSVSLELRNMESGLPGPNILPNGQVILPGFSTSQSDDASIGTAFRFDVPIYLQSNTEYCFVLKSTSLGYNAWCSRVGETDVLTSKVIDTNPYIGTLFKSENDNTWVAASYEDLKFNLNCAVFDNAVTSNIIMRPKAATVNNTPQYYASKQSLPLSYLKTNFHSKTIQATIPMHGLNTGDSIYTIVPVTDHAYAYNGLHYNQLIGMFKITRIDDDNVEFTAKSGTDINLTTDILANRTGAIPVKDGLTILDYQVPILPITPQNYAAPSVTNNDTFSLSTAPSADPNISVPPSPPAYLENPSFTVYSNIVIHEAMIDFLGTELPKTAITEKIKIAVGPPQLTNSDGSQGLMVYSKQNYETFVHKDEFMSFDQPRILATPFNESSHGLELGQDTSLLVNINFDSEDKNISPIIDLSGISVMTRTYKIDNQNDEIDILMKKSMQKKASIDDFNDPKQNTEIIAGSGTAAAKYKSSLVNMSDYYKSLKIYVVGNCPDPAIIDCYVRISTNETTHRDRNWIYVPFFGDLAKPFPYSLDRDQMSEWYFLYSDTSSFNIFDLKLVMRTKNPSFIPKIYSIRTIADDILTI